MRALLLGLALVAALIPASSQAAPEAQLWTSGEIRYRPTKGLWLGLEQHLRWDNNLTRLRKIMPEVGVRYRLHKYFRVGAGYRFIAEGDGDGSFALAHRGMLDLQPRYPLGPVEVSYRLRAQVTVGESSEPEPVLRQRLGLELETDLGLTPSLDGELYVQVGGGFVGATKWRVTLGVAQEIGDVDLSFYYRVQQPIGVPVPDRDTWHILGVGLRYSIR